LVVSVLFLPRNFSPLVPKRVRPPKPKKADVVQHRKAFDHVGLLFAEPPAKTGLFFV